MSDLVGNPEDKFSHNAAHMRSVLHEVSLHYKVPLQVNIAFCAF